MHILLRSSWQTVNIGDISHTPGALALFERVLPAETQVTLWPGSVDRGVEEMLRRRFPGLEIAKGKLDDDGHPDSAALREAFASADILVHGSGPSLVAGDHVRAWKRLTGKPYGFLGITLDQPSEADLGLVEDAAFLYCRDSATLDQVRGRLVRCPVVEFGPDAAFACDLRNETAAENYLRLMGLETGRFLVVIPRLRFTPYHEIHHYEPGESARAKAVLSTEMLEHDMELLRKLITAWIGETGMKVLLAPEMTYQMKLAREELYEKLPATLQAQVVVRDDYWLPDEATSVYARAAGLVSLEMHSPILAIGAGCPAIYVRQPTDTCKGRMWNDVGLEEWIYEIDHVTPEDLIEAALVFARQPDVSRGKAIAAHARAVAALETAAGWLNQFSSSL